MGHVNIQMSQTFRILDDDEPSKDGQALFGNTYSLKQLLVFGQVTLLESTNYKAELMKMAKKKKENFTL